MDMFLEMSCTIISLSAPSGPPQSLRVIAVSSMSIRLTWGAPLAEDQNGVLTSYRITVTEIESGEVLQRTVSASDSFLVVNSLRPHSLYRCTVAAFTIAIGPEANYEVTTLQEGNAIPIAILTSTYLTTPLHHEHST